MKFPGLKYAVCKVITFVTLYSIVRFPYLISEACICLIKAESTSCRFNILIFLLPMLIPTKGRI